MGVTPTPDAIIDGTSDAYKHVGATDSFFASNHTPTPPLNGRGGELAVRVAPDPTITEGSVHRPVISPGRITTNAPPVFTEIGPVGVITATLTYLYFNAALTTAARPGPGGTP